MEIKNEHNGIKYGDKCWVWDFNESDGDGDGDECFFLGYVKGASFPVKVIDEDGHNNGFKNARTLKTEAEKGLNLRLTGSNDLDGSDLKDGYVFSKDPMKPLSEWQTLEEICREAQA